MNLDLPLCTASAFKYALVTGRAVGVGMVAAAFDSVKVFTGNKNLTTS